MTIRARRLLIAPLLAITLGAAAFADLAETTVLDRNTSINFDTGAVASSGGDLLWNGSSLAPQGAAKVRSLGTQAAGFDTFGASYFTQQARSANTTPISSDHLAPGDIFVAVSNGGRIVKAIILGSARDALTLRFTTFGAPGDAAPAIARILNNSSGVADVGIAPSSIFIVQGSGLADPGEPVLHSSVEPGLPSTLNGASLTVVVNGVTTHPPLYYTSPTQLAVVLPAATPIGSGTLTVTYGGKTSAPAPVEVVRSAPGINSYYTNSGVATDAATGALLTFANSGSPGETIVLWATGLGANPADSDTTYTETPHAVDTPIQVFVGSVAATVLYGGASTFPGVNQINVTIPESAPSGCWIPLIVVAGDGAVSNVVTIPIRNGGGACVDELSGLTGDRIAPSGGKTLRAGLIAVIQTNTPDKNGRSVQNIADASFVKYSGLYEPAYSLSPGGCIVGPATPSAIPGITGLDVGTITLTGPSGAPVTMGPTGVKGTFFTDLKTGGIPDSGGTFTFTGSGGADVGAFTATVSFSAPLLIWTNSSAAATIDRTKPFNVTWTGGNPGSYVYILGGTRSALGVSYNFTCLEHAENRQFTVPAHVFLSMPAGSGSMMLQNYIQSPLTANGIDVGAASGDISYSVTTEYTNGGGTTGDSSGGATR